MSMFRPFEAPITDDIALISGTSDPQTADQADLRHWLINDWQTKMPPAGSLAMQIMIDYEVGLPLISPSELVLPDDGHPH